MIFSFRVFLRDYNGEEASTGIKLAGITSLGQLDTFAVEYSSVIEGLSDGTASKGEAYSKLPLSLNKGITGNASSFDRLLFLCTNGERYGSFTIPAPSPISIVSQGPYSGFLVDKTEAETLAKLNALAAFLSNSVLPDNTSFPYSFWQAALMVPRA